VVKVSDGGLNLKIPVLLVAALVASPMARLRAQPDAKLAFEVASIKPNTGFPSGVSGGCHGAPSSVFSANDAPTIPTGRCVINAARLSHLIPMAYDVPIGRVKGGPDWVWGMPRFNIAAKAENPLATYAELTRMLQALLADRFKLRIHHDAQSVSGYAMAVAGNGPKVKESSGAQEPSFVVRGAAINKLDAIDRKNLDLNSISGRKMSMVQLAEALSRLPGDVPVVDKTGLTGLYDFTLSWEPNEDLSRVVQEQLGLKLERQDVPVEFIIIDSAQPPTQN
jgi:uncharacterized protein (TIGR03435 family)